MARPGPDRSRRHAGASRGLIRAAAICRRPARRVAFVLKGYPRLSETFIAQEILALEQRGLGILIVSLRHPTDRAIHPVHQAIRADRLYLPEYLYQEPSRVWRGWRRARRQPGYRRALRVWLADLWRDPTPNRVRRFGQALVLAAELPRDVSHLHAHFLHTPASVARYAALIAGLDWTVSAHAKDIWTTPDWEKRAKLGDASWAVTCTAAGHAHLASLAPQPERVALCYHGLDLERFSPPPPRPLGGDGSDPHSPVVLLSVGRAVPKKGYDDLLAALALLPADLAWRFVHIGGGSLAATLRELAERLGLAPRIEWRGALAQPEVLDAYRRADLFVLAAKVTEDGDRDGLPNVLMEAQSQRLACVATDVSGIPELIESGATGLLVPPGDPPALARALARLIRDPVRRAALGWCRRGAGPRRLCDGSGDRPARPALRPRSGRRLGSARRHPGCAASTPRTCRGTLTRSAMRIAFYAPLKPPDHPVPSGDRRVAQLFLAALRLAGHEPALASRFRSFEGRGDRHRQMRLAALGQHLAERFLRRCRSTPGSAPDLWFTYHLYHKAPDWLGPRVAGALGIPYVIAEASFAPKQAGGAWDAGHRAAEHAIRCADAVIGLNPTDRDCVMPLLEDAARWVAVKPFLDAASYEPRTPAGRQPARLIAVAMMRQGDKLASYRVLGDALSQLVDLDWSLEVVGDGAARTEVAGALASVGDRVVWAGALGPAALARRLGSRRSLRVASDQRSLRHGFARSPGERFASHRRSEPRGSPNRRAGDQRSACPAGRRGGFRRGGTAADRRSWPARALRRSGQATGPGRARSAGCRTAFGGGLRVAAAGACRVDQLSSAHVRGPVTGAVLFYVQHLLGIGHLRRALHLVGALTEQGIEVTLVSGGEKLPDLAGAAAERVVQLTPIRARDAGFRDLVDGDGRPIDDALRARRRQALLDAFAIAEPDAVLIEAFPFGRRAFRFELEPLIEAARARRPRALVLCSLRDIVVAPESTQRRRDIIARVRTDFDAVLVHGDPSLIPLEASFPEASEIADRLVYTGYVGALRRFGRGRRWRRRR